MYIDFAKKLSLQIRHINIGTQKINSSKLAIFNIIITSFLVDDKDKRSRFFKETFLLINFSINIILEMPFLTLSNVEVNFINWTLS